MADAERPPREVHGVPDSFLDGKLSQEKVSRKPRIETKTVESMIQEHQEDAIFPPSNFCPFSPGPLIADCSSTPELERIPKKSLKPADVCPICNNPFLEGRALTLAFATRANSITIMGRSISSRRTPPMPQDSPLRPGMHTALAEAPCYVSPRPNRPPEEARTTSNFAEGRGRGGRRVG